MLARLIRILILPLFYLMSSFATKQQVIYHCILTGSNDERPVKIEH